MRVLVVTNQYAPVIGGIEIFLPQLLPELRSRGHEIEIVSSLHSTVREREGVHNGFPIHRLGLLAAVWAQDPAELLRERKQLASLLARFAPDLVHAHDVGPNVWALNRIGLDVPLLITNHLGLRMLARSRHGPMAAVLRESDWVTGVSDAVVEDLLGMEPSLAGRASVITNGIPAPTCPAPYRPSGKRVLCVGRLVEQKGFDVAIRAFPAVLAEHPGARLLFAGDGGERARLEGLAASLGVKEQAAFLGPVRHADIPALMASAAVVALPSRHEGMPLVVLEAGAAARPVACAATTGLLDAVVPDVTGTLFTPDDPAAMAAAVGALLAEPGRAAAYGRAGHRMVREEHSLSRCASEYDALYRRLAADRGRLGWSRCQDSRPRALTSRTSESTTR